MTGQAEFPYNMALRSSRALSIDDLDFFPTPPWALRAMIYEIIGRIIMPVAYLKHLICWENACGEGHMAIPLREIFGRVYASDIVNYEAFDSQDAVINFLDRTDRPAELEDGVDWIISNPPFADRIADFVEIAIDQRPRVGIAYLLRLPFVETEARYTRIFSKYRPSYIAYSSDRIPMIQGAYDPEASTATAYAWFIWLADDLFNGDAKGRWIPYGAERRHIKTSDLNIAKPGEAARRKNNEQKHMPLFREVET